MSVQSHVNIFGSPSSKLSFVKTGPALRIEGKSSIVLNCEYVVPVMVGLASSGPRKGIY